MSRLIVKNLPKGITENCLREVFGKKGHITDIQLKYTKEGVFRKFGFIGFQTEEEAAAATQYFNNTCINTSRITVEVCAALGADNKPQSWRKYAPDSSTYKRLHGIDEKATTSEDDKEKVKQKKNKNQRLEEIYGEHKNDPKFIEFMKIHGKNNEIWDNDLGFVEQDDELKSTSEKSRIQSTEKSKTSIKRVDDDNSEVEQSDDENVQDRTSDDDDAVKLADQEISDADYLKSLKNKKESTSADTSKKSGESSKTVTDLFTIKIREIPFKTKRQDVIKFFKPVKPFSIRLPTRKHGFCYVGFKTEREFTKAMLKHRSFLKGKQVLFTDFTEKNKEAAKKDDKTSETNNNEKNPKWAKQEEALKNEEDISESGKIFFRNLTYTVNEDQIQELFEKYGPITEVNLPIDPITRKIKGFGTVTFVMPEHAVRAFSELDGSIFHGRLLYLIPAKVKNDDELNDADAKGLSFKQKKDLKLKQTANSAHNWNALFMGADAVANSLAKNYQMTKEDILDAAGGGSSAAVRLALGETELIMEMRNFLEANDVVLDVFNQTPKKRSKTVILVKNLPADTTIMDIQPLFAKFGLLGRVVLPPSGITAIVEFLDSGEAKKAFSKLAYSKFKNLPLYLEWAPENTFKTNATQVMPQVTPSNTDVKELDEKPKKLNAFSKRNPIVDGKSSAQMQQQQEEAESYVVNESKEERSGENAVKQHIDDEIDETEPEQGTTLFLRNLNFSTQAETIREHFKHIGKIHHIQVAMKKDPENPQKRIPLGYGFIQFKLKSCAEKALKTMQITHIDGNAVELKRSDRTLQTDVNTTRKQAKAMKQTGTKILVRNIPFQAKHSEIRDIFKAFGELKSIRIPKKMTPGEDSHRGFGFIDFNSKSDAKKAFEALCHSTHLYGRRLVLEWAAPDEGIDELRKRTAEHYHISQSANKRSKKSIFDGSNIKKLEKTNADEDDDNDNDE